MSESANDATRTIPQRFRIVPKRDFGGQPFLINGRAVMSGFVVTPDKGEPWAGCNIMPGATWSETIRGALLMIKVLRKVGLKRDGSCADSDRFWRLLHRVNGTTQRSRRKQREMMERIGFKLVRRKGNTDYWAETSAAE